MIPKINQQTLHQLMRDDAIIITPTNRLSLEFLRNYLALEDIKVKKKPLCVSFSTFLKYGFQLVSQNKPSPLLLTNAQLRHLWRQIIPSHFFQENLISELEQAWTYCHFWNVNFNDSVFKLNDQTFQFQQWAQQLFNKLTELNAISESQLGSYLATQSNFLPQRSIVWACFDYYTPIQKELQNKFKNDEKHLFHYDLEDIESNFQRYAAQDEKDEFFELIRWLKNFQQPKKRFGIVIPNLETKRSKVARLMLRHFTAEEVNISLGKALVEYPLVAHALTFLKLEEKLSLHQARLLLNSPFLGNSKVEMLKRANALETATLFEELHFQKDYFIHMLEAKAPSLAALMKKIVPYPAKASLQEWIDHFLNRLKFLGFPGDYPLDSQSFQCYQRFMGLFDDFRELALITPQMSEIQAWEAINSLACTTVFQPKAKEDASIQILGLLEASGSSFDYLWIMNLTDQILPPAKKLSPFIPFILQKNLEMPYASLEKEYLLSTLLLKRFQNASLQGIISYPRVVEDKPCLGSSLVEDLKEYIPEQITPQALDRPFEFYTDQYNIPLVQDESIQGGSTLLANQAKCPFKAFAAHRLHLKNDLEPSYGPNAKERGKILHKVLELLWLNLKNQQNLLNLSADDRHALVTNCIEEALLPYANQHAFNSVIQSVEIERLKELVESWLLFEQSRPPFEVHAIEKEFSLTLADLNFQIRVDRIDEVEDNGKWIIDYKSNIPTTLPWNEELPTEPQLLLYALIDPTINTLLFAQIKAGQVLSKGLSENPTAHLGIKAPKENWTQLRENWLNTLTELAHSFIQGECEPNPINASICQYCNFQALCRYE